MPDEHWYYCKKCNVWELAREDQLTKKGIRCDCGEVIPYGTTGDSR